MKKSQPAKSLMIDTRSKMTSYFIIFIVFGIICFLSQDVSEARQIMKEKSFTVDISDSYQCGEEVELTINAPDRRFFKEDPRYIRTFIHNALPIICYECGIIEKKPLKYFYEKIQKIKIIGKVGNTRVYEGHSYKQEGWKVASDYLYDQVDNSRTQYGHKRIVKLKIRAPNNPAGIDYECTCEKNPVLPLKPIYYNNSDKALSKPVRISDYSFVARAIANKYLSECPGTETISFSLNPIPDGYICADGPPCYLTWSAEKPSKIMTGEFKSKPRLNDYNDVIKAFAEGNFDLLKEYNEFVRLFHNDFLERYSDMDNCRAHINNPVPFDVKTIETRYDSKCFIESEKEVGQTYRVYIDSKYADRFDAFYGPNQVWGALLLTKRITDLMSKRPASYGVLRGLSYLLNNLNQIDAFLSGRCMGKEVQLVYENLDRYYCHKPPLTLDGKISQPAGKTPASKSSNASKALNAPQPKLSEVALQLAVGSWNAVVDDRQVELVLWPMPNNDKVLIGFVYIPRHDCLMLATLSKDTDQSAVIYGKYGELALQFSAHNARDRKNNCMLNTGNLSGPYKKSFDGGGYITVNEKAGVLNFETQSLYLGECIACPKSKAAERKMDIEFRKKPVSAELLNILNAYENRIIGKPDASFLSEITK